MTKTSMNRFLYKIIISEARSRLRMAQYGVSQPICLRESDEEDIALTKELEEELKRFNYFETEDELQQRLDVLRRINHLVRTWVRNVSIQKNLPPEQVERAGGKLFTFGSYRLGVYTRGADIDSLCVAPRHVDRSDFFTFFFACLKEDDNVTELHAVEEAFVPVIKLKYSGIELDILFARLALKEVGDDQMLDDDNLLQNLDEKSIRSLNGCRVADEILKSIPNQHAFTVALRAIKLWARNHSIYSNSLGFLGGVSWAILVARTCQLYPNASASVIIEKLFLVFSTWEWPHPVFLKDTDNSPRPDIPKLNELVWDPRNRVTDRYHLMPIITPAFPEQNSTYNVTKSTRSIITNEFKDGLQIMLDIKARKKFWRHLFEEVNFFSRYKHFICLLCTTESEEDHLVFSSLVESKIRHLITFFERNQSVNLCHINPKKFKPLPDCELSVPYENPVVTLWFVGLELDRQVKNLDLTNEIQQFSDLVLKQASMTENYKPTMIVRPFHVPGKELKNWISENEVVRGVKYRARKKMVQQLVGMNQKEIRDEKANSLPTASIQGGSNSQPNNSLEENGSTPMSSSNPLLPQSASSPHMEGAEDVPPAPQLPMENAVLSNSGGLMNPNVARIKAKESKLKRKTFLLPPTTINESHQMFKSTSPSSAEMSPNSMAEMNPPPIKKQRFNFLSSPQNGTVL